MRKKFTALLFVSLSLAACETLVEEMELSGPQLAMFTVEIVSEPDGAIIEINDNYIGKTPLTVELEGWERTRTFARRHTILANPVFAGGQVQIKSFSGWYEPSIQHGDPIPEKIYFNMNLIRTPKEIDLNINK